jgi:hypothetical protein
MEARNLKESISVHTDNRGLRETISRYINDKLIVPKEKKLYLGDFNSFFEDTKNSGEIFLFVRKNYDRNFVGSLSLRDDSPMIRIGVDEEYLDMTFSKNCLRIKVQPYQITRNKRLEEAIEKEDWVSPPPFTISLVGDYQRHKNSIISTVEKYKKFPQDKSFFIPLLY